MQITFTTQDAEVQAKLLQLQRKIGNMQTVMEEIGARYERSVLENWQKQASPDGTPWKPLSVTTLMAQLGKTAYTKNGNVKKRKDGSVVRPYLLKSGALSKAGKHFLQNKSILVLTGRMRSRVHYQATSTSMTAGINGIPYAAIHQFGGMAGRGKKISIPARPWLAKNNQTTLVLADKDKTMIMEVIERHLA